MNEPQSRDQFEGIAIIGLAGRFPGARNSAEFWRNLRDGVESITSLTDNALVAAGVGQTLLNDPDYVKAGALLDDVEMFDAGFFGFGPREAETTDPQHRLFLECAWEALEDSGYDTESYDGRIGVYAGAGMNTYLLFNLYADRALRTSADRFQLMIGNDKDYLTTRVSYKLNLTGPSVAVQTACSTSLVAVHLACQSLLNGECDLALAGGVSVRVPHRVGYLYQAGGIASPDGHCRAFDAAAQGTIFGSGAGLVVLKRLADARADGDSIRAVIRGSAINNDGSLKVGYTAPRVASQAEVIAEALAMAGVGAETISYVEAHGTGTTLGDPIEIAALTQAFRGSTEANGRCALGSVKTNVGHLDAAAGVTGLIKTVLAMENKLLPPSLHFQNPNPQIDFANSPFFVNTELTEWRTRDSPRRAGVSSFGVGGTNAHVVVEEAPSVTISGASARPAQLLILSAKTDTALEAASTRLRDQLNKQPDLNLADMAYTLGVGRRAFTKRRALVCRDVAEAVTALETQRANQVSTATPEVDERPVAFMFTGQGSQYVQMGFALYQSEPAFGEQIDRCAELLRPHLGLDLRRVLYADATHAEDAARQLSQTALAQPALFVVEYALAQLLMKWGVRPQAMIGHSVGEYVAACIAEVFSVEDALRLLATRGRLMQRLPPGAMLAVALPERELLPLLNGRLSLAAINGAAVSVVSGPSDAIEELEKQLTSQGRGSCRLQTSHAFHSAMMDDVLAPFTQVVRETKLQPPRIPFLSSVTGTWITATEATSPDYWARQLRETVRFDAGLRELLREPGRILVEIGPGNTLKRLAGKHPDRAEAHLILATLPGPQESNPDVACLLGVVGQLWVAGVPIDWASYYGSEQRRRVPLPTYPFERQRYWIEPDQEEQNSGEIETLAASSATGKKAEIADWFYLPSWQRSVIRATDPIGEAVPGDRMLLFLDQCGLGSQLVARFTQAGHKISTVVSGGSFAKLAEGSYVIGPRNAGDYDLLLADLRARNMTPKTIVHLWNFTRERQSKWDRESAAEILYRGFYSLLFLAQAIGRLDSTERIQLRVVSSDLQSVNGGETLCPEKATLLGPCKVLPQEYPNLSCQSIDFTIPVTEHDLPARLLDHLLEQLTAELAAEPTDRVVAWRGIHRLVQAFAAVKLSAAPDSSARLRTGGVFLITGGLGGIGLELADHLARQAQARLVLIGRSAFPESADWNRWLATHPAADQVSAKIIKLQALEAAGAEVLVLRADVTDESQMRAVVTQCETRFGALNGIIHAAGIAGGTLAQLQSPAKALRVLAPKLAGARVLAAILKEKQLDFFLLFSSVNSILGGFGQVDYGAANAYLDALSHSIATETLTPTCSINWDTWAEVGMAVAGTQSPGRTEAERRTEDRETYHPLLDELVSETATQFTYTTKFSVARHWVLAEHKIIGGHGVVPGTAYLEMARAAAAQHAHGKTVELRDVLFVTPLVVEDTSTREVETVLQKGDDGFRFQIRSKTALPGEAIAAWQEHAHGQIVMVPPAPSSRLEIAGEIAVHAMTEVELTATARAQIRTTGFGPRWDNLKRAYAGPQAALALLELPVEFQNDLSAFGLHPALLDVATGFALLHKAELGDYLPLSYKRLTIKGALPGRVYSLVTYKNGASANDGTITYDLVVTDEEGVALIEIEGFTARRVADTGRQPQPGIMMAPPRKSPDPAGPDYVARIREAALRDGIQTSEGLNALNRILACRLPPQIVVSPRDFLAEIARAQALTTTSILEETVPLTVATPRIKHPRPDLKTPFASPAGTLEEALAELWQELLGVERLGSHDNFFELGGDSVLAIQIIARAHAMDLRFTPQQLFQNPTIAQLAVVVGAGQTGPSPASKLAARPMPTAAGRPSGDFPLAGLNAQQFSELSDLINEIDNTY